MVCEIRKLIVDVKTGKVEEKILSLDEADKELIDEFIATPDKDTIKADGVDETTITVYYNKNWKLTTWKVNVTVYDSNGNVVTTDEITLSDAGNCSAIGHYIFSSEVVDSFRFEFELVDLGLKAKCEVTAI